MAIIDNIKGLFWINGSNYGDLLSKVLYKEITGKEPVHTLESPRYISIGSIAHVANPGDIFWGTGCMSPGIRLACNETNVALCVRGPFTDIVLRQYGVNPAPVFGDPCLLLPRYIKPAKEPIYRIGVVPHYADAHLFADVPVPVDGIIIHANQDPYKVIQQITSCKFIISSTLHGLVTAEAYGIPAIWAEFSDNVAGGGFKFYDYYAGTGRRGVHSLDFKNMSLASFFDIIDNRLNAHTCPQLDHLDIIANRMLDICPYERKSQ